MIVVLRLAEGVEVRARTSAVAERLSTGDDEDDGDEEAEWEDDEER